MCKVFCLFFSSLLAIQLSVLQINCLISVPHSQDCWGRGKPGSCIPVLLGGKCSVLLLGMPYYHMVSSVNKPHRERCVSFGSPRRTPRCKWGFCKEDCWAKRKKSDLFLFCKEIDNWWLVGGAAPCHGEIHIQIVTRLSPKVHSLPRDQ